LREAEGYRPYRLRYYVVKPEMMIFPSTKSGLAATLTFLHEMQKNLLWKTIKIYYAKNISENPHSTQYIESYCESQ